MKKLLIFASLSLTLFLAVSCMIKQKSLPKIVSPTYESYSNLGERGYKVEFSIENSKFIPKAIIINKIRQEMFSENKSSHYLITIPVESRKINGLKPQGSNLENGIIFIVDGKEVLKPVNFRMK